MASDFDTARMNMVLSQLKPNDVYESDVLRAFESVPREQFVDEGRGSLAYVDEDIKIANLRYLMEPSVFARLVQHADLNKDSYVLSIGCGYGYGPAILSKLCKTVIAVESEPTLFKAAKEKLSPDFYDNVVLVQAPLNEGNKKDAPYDAIFVEGSCATAPQGLLEQLSAEGGKLYYIERPLDSQCGQAICIQRYGSTFGRTPLFDANTPYIKGFEPEEVFQF